MNDKNIVINNYVSAIIACTNNLSGTLSMLCDSAEVNNGLIATADIIITSLNSQLIVLQNALDNYGS